MEEELTEKEQQKIKIQQALFELKIMGDRFAKENAAIIKEYIESLEEENEILKLKLKIGDEI